MKKTLLAVALVLTLIAAGCSNSKNNETDDKASGKDTQEVNKNTEANNEQAIGEVEDSQNDEATNNMQDLSLQLLKSDEEAGATIENNEIYGALDELVKSDPKIGIPNDFSLYPFDIAEFEGDSDSFIFLAINRLKDPIKNVSFDLTFGNQDGEYIWDGTEINLDEEQFGVIEPDSSVPILIDISSENEKLYESLNKDNVYMNIDNFDMDVVE